MLERLTSTHTAKPTSNASSQFSADSVQSDSNETEGTCGPSQRAASTKEDTGATSSVPYEALRRHLEAINTPLPDVTSSDDALCSGESSCRAANGTGGQIDDDCNSSGVEPALARPCQQRMKRYCFRKFREPVEFGPEDIARIFGTPAQPSGYEDEGSDDDDEGLDEALLRAYYGRRYGAFH